MWRNQTTREIDNGSVVLLARLVLENEDMCVAPVECVVEALGGDFVEEVPRVVALRVIQLPHVLRFVSERVMCCVFLRLHGQIKVGIKVIQDITKKTVESKISPLGGRLYE